MKEMIEVMVEVLVNDWPLLMPASVITFLIFFT